jgi:hypothetical protein
MAIRGSLASASSRCGARNGRPQALRLRALASPPVPGVNRRGGAVRHLGHCGRSQAEDAAGRRARCLRRQLLVVQRRYPQPLLHNADRRIASWPSREEAANLLLSSKRPCLRIDTAIRKFRTILLQLFTNAGCSHFRQLKFGKSLLAATSRFASRGKCPAALQLFAEPRKVSNTREISTVSDLVGDVRPQRAGRALGWRCRRHRRDRRSASRSDRTAHGCSVRRQPWSYNPRWQC